MSGGKQEPRKLLQSARRASHT